MGDLSQHFSRSEFKCLCGCGTDTVDVELIHVLEDLRHHFDVPVGILSGHRCEKHNRNVGGKPRSQHLLGRAADITTTDFTPAALYRYLDEHYPMKFGIGKYDDFVHIDTRKSRARW